MAKRNFVRLDIGQEMFTIIGISSHENDYRLSWSINEQMGLTFAHGDSFVTQTGKGFACFVHEDEDRRILLISNRCDNGFLLEKYKSFDFILKFDAELNETEIYAWLRDLRKVSLVSAVIHIPVNKQILSLLG